MTDRPATTFAEWLARLKSSAIARRFGASPSRNELQVTGEMIQAENAYQVGAQLKAEADKRAKDGKKGKS